MLIPNEKEVEEKEKKFKMQKNPLLNKVIARLTELKQQIAEQQWAKADLNVELLIEFLNAQKGNGKNGF
jgi:uncharacterized protein (DUF342 family)